jgi:hypothetical protein
MIIDLLWDEFETWRMTLPSDVEVAARELDRPGDAGRAVRLDAETSLRLVQVTMWDTGEVDMVVGDLSTGDVLANEHMEVTTRLGIKGLLSDVSDAVR